MEREEGRTSRQARRRPTPRFDRAPLSVTLAGLAVDAIGVLLAIGFALMLAYAIARPDVPYYMEPGYQPPTPWLEGGVR